MGKDRVYRYTPRQLGRGSFILLAAHNMDLFSGFQCQRVPAALHHPCPWPTNAHDSTEEGGESPRASKSTRYMHISLTVLSLQTRQGMRSARSLLMHSHIVLLLEYLVALEQCGSKPSPGRCRLVASQTTMPLAVRSRHPAWWRRPFPRQARRARHRASRAGAGGLETAPRSCHQHWSAHAGIGCQITLMTVNPCSCMDGRPTGGGDRPAESPP